MLPKPKINFEPCLLKQGPPETKSIIQPPPSGISWVLDLLPPPLRNFQFPLWCGYGISLTPPPLLRNFQFPLWWGYGYFLEPHNHLLCVLKIQTLDLHVYNSDPLGVLKTQALKTQIHWVPQMLSPTK